LWQIPSQRQEDSPPKTPKETPENGKQENGGEAPRRRRSLGRARFEPAAGSINPRFAAQARRA